MKTFQFFLVSHQSNKKNLAVLQFFPSTMGDKRLKNKIAQKFKNYSGTLDCKEVHF